MEYKAINLENDAVGFSNLLAKKQNDQTKMLIPKTGNGFLKDYDYVTG